MYFASNQIPRVGLPVAFQTTDYDTGSPITCEGIVIRSYRDEPLVADVWYYRPRLQTEIPPCGLRAEPFRWFKASPDHDEFIEAGDEIGVFLPYHGRLVSSYGTVATVHPPGTIYAFIDAYLPMSEVAIHVTRGEGLNQWEVL